MGFRGLGFGGLACRAVGFEGLGLWGFLGFRVYVGNRNFSNL